MFHSVTTITAAHVEFKLITVRGAAPSRLGQSDKFIFTVRQGLRANYTNAGQQIGVDARQIHACSGQAEWAWLVNDALSPSTLEAFTIVTSPLQWVNLAKNGG